MPARRKAVALLVAMTCLLPAVFTAAADDRRHDKDDKGKDVNVQVGPRPYYLVQ